MTKRREGWVRGLKGFFLLTLMMPLLVVSCGRTYFDIYGEPKDPQAVNAYLHSQVHKEAERYERALPWLRAAMSADPDSLWLRAEEADLLRLIGQLDAAQEKIDQVLDDHPDHARARLVAAQIDMDKGDAIEEAARHLDAALELDPGLVEAVYLRARIAIERDEIARADQVLAGLTLARPGHAGGWSSRGNLAYRVADYALAIESYEEYLDIRQSPEKIFLQLADAYAKTGKEKDQINTLADCVEARSAHLDCKIAFVKAVIERQSQEPLEDLADTLVLCVSHDAQLLDVPLLVELSTRLLTTQSVEDAAPFVEAVLIHRPDLNDLTFSLGRAYRRAGQDASALQAFRRVGEGSDLRPDALAQEAELLLELGLNDSALEAARALAAAEPERSRGAGYEAEALARKGDFDGAIARLEDVDAELSPQRKLQRCALYEAAQRLEEALPCYARFLELEEGEDPLLSVGFEALRAQAKRGQARVEEEMRK